MNPDDELMEAEMRKHEKKVAVKPARRKRIRRRRQRKILDAFGKFEFDPTYDYKAERKR